jgi:hydrogenase maturation protease
VTVLVAGVGNVFLGDDGFGVEVVRRLSTRDIPSSVRVADYGIRGTHLAYDIAGAEHALVVLVDATSRGEPPGTVYVVELDGTTEISTAALDAHGMTPDAVLELVSLLGGRTGRVLLVGCEPATLDEGMGLSPVVERAVDTAVTAVLDLLAENAIEQESPCAWESPAK